MIVYIVTFIELLYFFCSDLIQFTVRIPQKSTVFYLFCTIKKLSVFLFAKPYSKRSLNKFAKKDDEWACFWLGNKRYKHTIVQSRFFIWSGEFYLFLRSRY